MGSLFGSPKSQGPSAQEIRDKELKDKADAKAALTEGVQAQRSRVSRSSLVQPGLYIPPSN